MSAQLPLPLALAPHARFETFVGGPNDAVVAHLRDWSGAGDSIWIWGPSGSGKSHLLQAACAARPERRAIYLPFTELASLATDALEGLEMLDLVAIDDIERVAASAAWNRALFGLVNALQAEGGRLLIGASGPPGGTAFELPDLASRAAAATVYQLAPLGDEDLVRALRVQADSRGLELADSAARYLLARVRRDMAGLCAWLQTLDRASLAEQRKITIPLIRETLARGS